MKKIIVLLLLLLPVFSFAQWLDISAVGGIAPYKISAGIKNSMTGAFNVSAAVTKFKFVEFGVQYTYISKITVGNITSPGAFVDLIVLQDDEKKNVISLGADLNFVKFGPIKTPAAIFKDGSTDTLATTIDKSSSYGIRMGYKRRLADHIYVYGLLSPMYTLSTIRYGNVYTNTCAVLYIPAMIGLSVRF
ncbi:MAG: hypothetical protein JWQ38_2736 [Flavipsychrobacter sp.]|nr:hypothetical protein [Flavipsychrobacter sp.]